jgi:alpha-ketoglutarate-dependent taurine dioxygenase
MHTEAYSDNTFALCEWLESQTPMKRLDAAGWVVIDDVPQDKMVVETILANLGELQPQYGGEKFWNVLPRKPGKGSSIGDQALPFHTELAEFPEPPEYVALYCIRAADVGGALRLVDVFPLLNSVSQQELEELAQVQVTITCDEEIAALYGKMAFTGPLLSRQRNRLAIRFDPPSDLGSLPACIRAFTARLLEFAEERAITFAQPPGTLMVWNNRRVLHGRTAFQGTDRHLWRCCVANGRL